MTLSGLAEIFPDKMRSWASDKKANPRHALDSVPCLESAVCNMTVGASLESYAQNQEDILAWDYFDHKTDGFFVEVGANHPTELSQTWFLEQRGWKGILVEPLPACCEKLRAVRKNSIICEAAAGAPEQVGEATLNVAQSDVWSHLGEENKELPLAAVEAFAAHE